MKIPCSKFKKVYKHNNSLNSLKFTTPVKFQAVDSAWVTFMKLEGRYREIEHKREAPSKPSTSNNNFQVNLF